MQSLKTPKNHTQKKIKRYQEQDPAKVDVYHEAIKDIPPESIVYIDEMGIETFVYREYAYAKRGTKVIDSCRKTWKRNHCTASIPRFYGLCFI